VIPRLYARMPGPPLVRVILLVLLGMGALALLLLVFEWAGRFIDPGGTVAR
jgi:hypothetical protein